MIECKINEKNATYGSENYCKSCGMSLTINPIVKNNKGHVNLYCCEECAKAK